MADAFALNISRWNVGFHHPNKATVLRFELRDREPVVLMVSQKSAIEMAKAILEQYERTPPTKDRFS